MYSNPATRKAPSTNQMLAVVVGLDAPPAAGWNGWPFE
jgi:hypothetical protein